MKPAHISPQSLSFSLSNSLSSYHLPLSLFPNFSLSIFIYFLSLSLYYIFWLVSIYISYFLRCQVNVFVVFICILNGMLFLPPFCPLFVFCYSIFLYLAIFLKCQATIFIVFIWAFRFYSLSPTLSLGYLYIF